MVVGAFTPQSSSIRSRGRTATEDENGYLKDLTDRAHGHRTSAVHSGDPCFLPVDGVGNLREHSNRAKSCYQYVKTCKDM